MTTHLSDGTWAVSLTAIGSFVSGFLARNWYRSLCDFFDPPEVLPKDFLLMELRAGHRELVLTRSTLGPNAAYSDYLLPLAVIALLVAWYVHFTRHRRDEKVDEETVRQPKLPDVEHARVRPGAARSRRSIVNDVQWGDR